MTNNDLPKLKRDIPRPMAWLFTAMMYGFMRPLNWMMTRRGGKPMVLRPNKRYQDMLEKFRHAFDDYTPTEHDVFVNTYAKSGTNWMMQIAYQVAFRGEGEFANIYDVVPWPEMAIQMGTRYFPPLDDLRVQQASPTGLRIIKTHLQAQYLPFNPASRYITVIRDPKDAFVSSYHFQAGIYGPVMPSVADWLDNFLTDDFLVGFGSSWAQHTASNWALRENPNVLVVSFSEMKRDLPGVIQKVADLLGVTLTPAQLDTIAHKSSFDYMKALDDRFFPVDTGSLPWAKVSMVRSGKEGASGELLTPEQQRRIDTHFIAELKALGSDFPYEEFCRVSY